MQGQTGIIILDDPMVDLDPERQKLASKAIEEFAKKQQILVMTCHSEHGGSLDGANQVEI